MADRATATEPACVFGASPASRDHDRESLPHPILPGVEDSSSGENLPSISGDSHGPRRRSSVVNRISALGDIGGVNSFNNFARSWSRAAGFHEFAAPHTSFVAHEEPPDDQEEQRWQPKSSIPAHAPQRSLLRAALENEGHQIPENPIVDDAEFEADNAFLRPLKSASERGSLAAASVHEPAAPIIEPYLASPFSNSYGSVGSRFSQPSIRPPQKLSRGSLYRPSGSEGEPLLTKHVADPEESKTIEVIIGQSTVPQTIFNSVNTLIGVGMLSLPLAFKYSGWVVGMIFFLVAAITTSYTAKLLAKCLDVDRSLLTFADLAYVSFGSRARVAISVLFCMELLASCVALIVLFADTMNALIASVSIPAFKVICGVILVPLAFLPLRFLSFTSVLGIFCCLWIVTGILADGVLKRSGPGSLLDPSQTYAVPTDWRTLPLAYGLLMAPWGGHGVFPNIYRDMRHPAKYAGAVNITYIFTWSLEVVLAAIGYLMFGDFVRDEITSNIFLGHGYPRWLSITLVVAIAIIPLTKCPLNARPIFSTVEILLDIQTRTAQSVDAPEKPRLRLLLSQILARSCLTCVFVLIAIVVPSFDRIMSLVGSLACSLVCVVLPCCFHLKIFWRDLRRSQKVLDGALAVSFALMGTAGTVCAFLPKRWLGAAS